MAISGRKRVAVGSVEDYEETCSLGTGSYGSVVKARRRGNGQFVAIKHVGAPGHCQGLSEAVAREAEFLEACRGNPFVVGYHGLVRARGSMELRIVMDCVVPKMKIHPPNLHKRRKLQCA